MTHFQKAVEGLLKDGYAFVPVDAVMVANAMSATRKLLSAIGDDTRWTLTRVGENEPDVGRIKKSKAAGYDEKVYFHFARDLPLLLEYVGVVETPQQKACLEKIDQLHRSLQALALGVVSELEDRDMIATTTSSLMLRSFRLTEPYNTGVLRYLQYPDVKNQTGAKDHYDKGLLSIHLGDDGGELYALDRSNTWVAVSPPPGMALVFFGVKILYASLGRLTPLRHKATTVAGMIRTAMVLFAHADIGYDVMSAQDSYEAFYKNR